MSVRGFGRCPECRRQILEFTPVRTMKRGDGRSHLVHKKCLPDPAPPPPKPINVGSYIPPLVITTEAPIGAEYPSTPDAPSMPTREQTGKRKRGR